MGSDIESTLYQGPDPICDESLICSKTMCNYNGSVIQSADQSFQSLPGPRQPINSIFIDKNVSVW